MDDEWMKGEEEESFSLGRYEGPSVDESLEHYEVNVSIVSDRLKRLFQKAGQYKNIDKKDADSIEKLGASVSSFVLDNIKIVDYRDIAKLIGIKPEILKMLLMKTGMRMPSNSLRRWKDIQVGVYKSISDCAKCQIQLNHHTFYVGLNDCRKCYEENLKFWIHSGETISLIIPDR